MAPSVAQAVMRRLPFARTTTPLQAATYLLGISLFSISFLVFLNSSISFVITDRIGVKHGVGNIVGTLGFVDELVALVACPGWGLVSDRLGVRLVAVLGYAIVALALVLSVQATNVYPQLLLARVLFALGASASATMVTAILPSLTDDSEPAPGGSSTNGGPSTALAPATTPTLLPRRNPRDSALSIESQLTITPERFAESLQHSRTRAAAGQDSEAGEAGEAGTARTHSAGKPAKLAGFVGLFTGCGALVALVLFLPLPAEFGRADGVTMAEAVARSFYVVAAVAVGVAGFVFVGLRNLRGEDGKGWRMLLGKAPAGGGSSLARRPDEVAHVEDAIAAGPSVSAPAPAPSVAYWRLLRESVELGFSDADIALGYLGGFVARASSVAISLFMPLFVNAFFIGNGFCQGAPNDPSPELKKECRAAYVLASILTGVAQLMGLLCAPVFGYLASRPGRVNVPLVVATTFGIVGYIVFPLLRSPEPTNVDGRGGSPAVFAVATLIGVSQIGSIVCSLGSLGKGVLAVDRATVGDSSRGRPGARHDGYAAPNGEADASEGAPLLVADGNDSGDDEDGAVDEDADTVRDLVASPRSARSARSARTARPRAFSALSATAAAPGSFAGSRIRLKGSIAGVYSLCGGAAILLLTKLGGYLFDHWSRGAPFYMMAVFNGLLLVATLGSDASRAVHKLKQ